MHPVFDLEGEGDNIGVGVAFVDPDLLNGGVLFRYPGGKNGDAAALRRHFHLDLGGEFAIYAGRPVEGDAFFRVEADVVEVLAVFHMHHQAAPGADVAHDGVAGDGVATARVAEQQAL